MIYQFTQICYDIYKVYNRLKLQLGWKKQVYIIWQGEKLRKWAPERVKNR